jgi:UDP-3-O-[3-hydroxymyristoyl] N-acetylglucosamine deacetylase/3-hydroxyacyl-[acyl-carrier-protein] dehydratase
VAANIAHVVKRPRRTTLESGDASVDMCEHCLSAVAALGVDNLIIELDNQELPGLDGSAKPYLDVLQEAGLEAQEEPRRTFKVDRPIVVERDGAMIAALPHDKPAMEIVFDLDYGDDPIIGRQVYAFDMSNGSYASQIAPARTYLFEAEAKAAVEKGIGSHLTADDFLVLGEDGPLGGNELRFANEPVRHKIVDLIGDLWLLGMPIRGRIMAHRSGHTLNHALVRAIIEEMERRHRQSLLQTAVIDTQGLLRMLPHRYPMLLVDRVVEMDSDRRAVGVKNVTANEPFFAGHYPGTPIMPGVLIVEAMAQLSGVLIGQKLEHMGKLAVLLSLDRVRLRRPVTPGDQIVMEAETVRIRDRIAHMRCRAYVAEDLAAEAEVKFMLVDDEQQQ